MAGPNAAATAIFETATVMLSPQDTFLALDNTNYSTNTLLMAYTWPDYQVADAIVMKFDFSALPTGAIIQKAELNLALVQSDAAAGAYTMTAHKLLGQSAVIGAATGYTADGTTSWTANACCSGGIPMAQADISTPYDSAAIDPVPGFKAWDVTAMVQEWMLAPATNFGLLLNADITSLRDRYRYFASMEHASSSLRPFLRVTYAAVDVAPPSVAISAPGSGTVLTGTAGVEATATDNVAVAAVQFQIEGAPVGPELTSAPYRLTWDTTMVSDGTYTLTAVARDSAGNSAPSAGVSVTIENGILILTPEDTVLNLDAANYSTRTTMAASTRPHNRAANAILMKFDFAAVPAGTVVQEATLHLNLVESDASVDNAYVVAAHKIVGKNAVIAAATGYTADGATTWTPNACCQNGVPLAQADISAAYDSPAIDKAAGFKTWDVTAIVQEWLLDPATNAGLLLNADASKPGDRYRIFASTEHADATRRPFLRIRYSPEADIIVSALDGSATSESVTSEAFNPLIEASLAPAAAAPVSPSGSIATATPAFSWSAVTNATYYALSITDADTGSPVEAWYTPLQAGCPIGTGTCTVAAPRTLKPGLVTWKVLTYNLDGYGPWSSPMTAVVEAVDGALQPPTAIGPTGAISTRTPTYSWNPMSGVVWYQVSVTDALGSSNDFWYTPVQVCASSPCAVTPNVLLAIGPAQWRVRAWSAVGASAWTAPVSFEAANAAPGQATLIAPAGATTSQTPTFTWNGLLGVSYYLLRVIDGDNTMVEFWYRPSEAGCPLGTEVCSASPGLSVNPGPAEWQILTWNAVGWGPWSDARAFTVEKSDPAAGVPVPLSPTGSIATSHPTYTWSALNGATRYRLSIRINGGPATHSWYTPAAAACDAINCHVQPNITLENGTAEWQVQMWTANGHGNWSAVVPLSVTIAAPPAPDLASPSGVTSPSPSFVWEPSANAAYYYVRVSDATGLQIDQWLKPEEVGCFSEVANCTLNADVTLNIGAGSWEALAWNPTGYSPWSPTVGFVVSSGDVTPPVVAIAAPADGINVSDAIVVSANAADNIGVVAVQFKLEGANLNVEDTTNAYSTLWDTTTVPDGTYTLTAVARDAVGNVTTSAGVRVNVKNAPTITGFTPTSGATATSVTISGTKLNGATTVRFNGTSASFTVSSASAIQATVPAGATTGSVSVTKTAGTATSGSNFTVVAVPTITSFTPTSGAVGTSVTISGTNFTGATAVRFNGTSATFTVSSATAIQTTVPAGAATGTLSVTTAGGTATSASNFTVVSPPTITSFTPASGPVATSVTINGTNFTGATAVRFNGTSATFTVSSATAIQATVPAGAATGTLSVTTAGGTATSSSNFTVVAVPTITSFTPTSGAVGTSVTITGTNFTGATAVRFNGTSATFTVSSATAIQATVPAGAATGTLSVTTAAGTATSSSTFTVSAPPPPPIILWSADHEEGNMSDWYENSGGNESNSGNAVTGASRDVAHTGLWSAKATITTPPGAGARLFRKAKGNPDPSIYAYYSAWYYIPVKMISADFNNIFQFKSLDSGGVSDPFWDLKIRNRSNGNMYLTLNWWSGLTVEGPHQGESGGRAYQQALKDLPVGQWFHLEAYLRQSAGFTGQIIIWQDGVEIFNQNNVKTRYSSSENDWSINNYGDHVVPNPFTMYFDDAAISTARLGAGSSDSTPPSVSLSAPAPGATVSGTATVSASASDNVGVVGVQFKLDGVNLGAEDTTSPYSVSWDTTTAINGSHTLSASVRDAAGNTAVSAARTVTVSNTGTLCQTSGASWQNQTFASRNGIFTAQYDATPSALNIDGVTGLAGGAGTTYTDLAAIVRFNNSGNIDARNGGAYAALAPIPYAAGTTYRVRMVVNVPAHTYSAFVTPSGGSEVALGLDYAFRSEQAAANTLSSLASVTIGGTLQICNLTVTP